MSELKSMTQRKLACLLCGCGIVGAIAITLGAWHYGAIIFMLLTVYAFMRARAGGPPRAKA